MRRRRAIACTAGVAALLSLSGCQSMLFRQDHRIEVVSPATSSTVSQPVTLRWTARDFTAPRDGRFAVFVDRDPMPPGQTLNWFSPHDRRDIYVLDGTSLPLRSLHEVAGASSAERNHHDVTVVLLDPGGHRVGESAGVTEFTVKTD